jgi:hypothetical protein
VYKRHDIVTYILGNLKAPLILLGKQPLLVAELIEEQKRK